MAKKFTEQHKKKAREFAAFITDVAQAMMKHKVTDMLCVFELNGDIRNTYIPLDEKTGEKPLYCNISDGIDAWLKIRGATVSGKKHTGSLSLNNSKPN